MQLRNKFIIAREGEQGAFPVRSKTGSTTWYKPVPKRRPRSHKNFGWVKP